MRTRPGFCKMVRTFCASLGRSLTLREIAIIANKMFNNKRNAMRMNPMEKATMSMSCLSSRKIIMPNTMVDLDTRGCTGRMRV